MAPQSSTVSPGIAPPPFQPLAEPKWAGGKERLIVLAGLLVYGLVLVWNAWVAEDAYICLRTIDNCVNGRGLTWNPGERVQSFTCPLWVLLLTGVYWFTHEAFLTTLAVCGVVSMLTAMVLSLGVARGCRQGLLVVALLTGSKAGVDYATSGLENPLTHLLLALFALVYFSLENNRAVLGCSLLASLGAVNRLDTILLYLPALLLLWVNRPTLGRAGLLLLGFLPLLAWEAFALCYFGFLFPNTAYAKLGTGIGTWELLVQGRLYLTNSLFVDPLTPAVIAAGVLLPLVMRLPRSLALSAGAMLYVVYVVKVGGDFMSGRFLTAPLVLSIAVLARVPALTQGRFVLATAALALLLTGLGVQPPPLTGIYRRPNTRLVEARSKVADEAEVYRSSASLLRNLCFCTEPDYIWVEQGRQARRSGLRVALKNNVGYFGYYAGPDITIVDPLALTDPLLARLPAVANPEWRIGHFARKIPDGYLETLATEENRLVDPGLAEYLQRLNRVTRGPLFEAERWREIWNFNTGGYNHLLPTSHYRDSTRRVQKLGDLPGQTRDEEARQVFFCEAGLEVDLQNRRFADRLKVTLNDQSRYVIVFLDGATEVGRCCLAGTDPLDLKRGIGWGQLAAFSLIVPEAARATGFDRLLICPKETTVSASLGWLSFE